MTESAGNRGGSQKGNFLPRWDGKFFFCGPSAFRALFVLVAFCVPGLARDLPVDDGPARPGEWGFHPTHGEALAITPPGFAWRSQADAASYEIRITGAGGVRVFEAIGFNVFCPDAPLAAGDYTWQYRFRTRKAHRSAWSRARAFTIEEDAVEFPLPDRDTLLARIPERHPRLFVRPGEIAALKRAAAQERKVEFDRLVRVCETLLANPPSTEEPPTYPRGTVRKSEEWRAIWWGNRTRTIKVLDGAATLAFTGLIAERTEFQDLARRLLLDSARWNPHGATGYRYNDEAGMPYAYHFARTYTFLHPALTEEERALCREVMTARGREMYRHLCPRHLGFPYSSHSNRAWHFLGEVGIAFHGEIPEAGDWVWFAANVFRNVYPVWSDSDGGWHEGMSYWLSYMGRFTWWADVMQAALGLDAYAKPYFARIGDFPLYLMPPGQRGGGFGDLCGRRQSKSNVPLCAIVAAQARNPHWQWYVDAHGGPPEPRTYIDFVRGAHPPVAPTPPVDLPTSRLFGGTGVAALNTTLVDAGDNVQVLFKSSPFGTQSHGYESQNAFLVNAFGERLFIRSGHRDIYGSAHHKNWMWQTKSVNAITVNGKGQRAHSAAARGRITEFHTSERIDYVAGEAAEAYGGKLDTFRRRILFVKPTLIVIFDSAECPAAAQTLTGTPIATTRFDWWLHSAFAMDVTGNEATVEGAKSAARVTFFAPGDLAIAVTDRFDPPPRPRIELTQWHLSASYDAPCRRAEFVTVIEPFRKGSPPAKKVHFERTDSGFALRATTAEGAEAVIYLGSTKGPDSTPRVHARIADRTGKRLASFTSRE